MIRAFLIIFLVAAFISAPMTVSGGVYAASLETQPQTEKPEKSLLYVPSKAISKIKSWIFGGDKDADSPQKKKSLVFLSQKDKNPLIITRGAEYTNEMLDERLKRNQEFQMAALTEMRVRNIERANAKMREYFKERERPIGEKEGFGIGSAQNTLPASQSESESAAPPKVKRVMEDQTIKNPVKVFRDYR